MIEADLETKICEKLAGVLSAAGLDDIQTCASFQVADIKAVQESSKNAYLTVKASPRSYATPTVPTCTIDVEVLLAVRADIDYNGRMYIDIADALMTQYERWQKCDGEAHDDFTTADFDITGFVLGMGSTAVDSNVVTFTYTHAFTVYGVVI